MSIEINVLNKTIKADNFISIALIEQFALRFPEKEAYVYNKADQIKNLDAFNCILYWFNLDENGRRVFADRLNIPPRVLAETAKGLKMIFNARV
jgi:hypothetical protein